MKKTIAVSFLLMALSALLISLGTFAYFSDSASSTGNTFSTGAFHFNIKDPGTTGHTVFNVTNMKPGDVATGYIAVTNDSDAGLGMKWHAWIDGSGTLGNVLDVKVTLNPSGYDTSALTAAGYTMAGPANQLITDYAPVSSLGSGNSVLVWAAPAVAFAPGWAAVYKVEVRMNAAADNTYQGASYTGAIDFAATQYDNPGW